MIKLTATGVFLMLILATVGGYMTGMFAGSDQYGLPEIMKS